jgi:hypothetical protein
MEPTKALPLAQRMNVSALPGAALVNLALPTPRLAQSLDAYNGGGGLTEPFDNVLSLAVANLIEDAFELRSQLRQ